VLGLPFPDLLFNLCLLVRLAGGDDCGDRLTEGVVADLDVRGVDFFLGRCGCRAIDPVDD
jgi:hypothetical protein